MINFFLASIKDYRYEFKFFINTSSESAVENKITFHPMIFREMYHPRRVNSIYFDSLNLEHYYDNICGIGKRLKVRVRWYKDKFGLVDKPMLELKLKNGQYVGKLLYPLKRFTFDSYFTIYTIRQILKESSIPEILKEYINGLNLSVFISYNRKYFLSSDQKFRLTLDKSMEVYQLSPFRNNFLTHSVDHNSLVLELKCDTAHRKSAEKISKHLPFRVSRSSKYVTGVKRVNHFNHSIEV